MYDDDVIPTIQYDMPYDGDHQRSLHKEHTFTLKMNNVPDFEPSQVFRFTLGQTHIHVLKGLILFFAIKSSRMFGEKINLFWPPFKISLHSPF